MTVSEMFILSLRLQVLMGFLQSLEEEKPKVEQILSNILSGGGAG